MKKICVYKALWELQETNRDAEWWHVCIGSETSQFLSRKQKRIHNFSAFSEF